jgi:integrase
LDMDAGVLSVRQTCQYLSGIGFTFRQPKSHRSTRPVVLPLSAVERLRAHRRMQLEQKLLAGPAYEEHGLVFATATGSPIHQTSLHKAWTNIAGRAGVPRLRFHDLRHCHASLLLGFRAAPGECLVYGGSDPSRVLIFTGQLRVGSRNLDLG